MARTPRRRSQVMHSSKRKLVMTQLSPRRIRLKQVKDSPVRSAMRSRMTMFKLTGSKHPRRTTALPSSPVISPRSSAEVAKRCSIGSSEDYAETSGSTCVQKGSHEITVESAKGIMSDGLQPAVSAAECIGFSMEKCGAEETSCSVSMQMDSHEIAVESTEEVQSAAENSAIKDSVDKRCAEETSGSVSLQMDSHESDEGTVIVNVPNIEDIAVNIRTAYSDHLDVHLNTASSTVIVHQKELNSQCSAGPIYNPRLLISSNESGDLQLEFQVFFRSVLKVPYTSEIATSYLKSMIPDSGYVVCPGIPCLPSSIRFKPKHYREWTLPFVRHDSHNCKLWYHPSDPMHRARKRFPSDPLFNSCSSCKLLWTRLTTLAKRTKSPSSRAKWQLPSSKKPKKYLSPLSQRLRNRQARLDRKAMMKSLHHYVEKYDVTLNDDQHSELLNLVSSISDIGKEELKKVMSEADAKGKGELLRNVWKMDVEERLQYFKDQKKNVTGRKGNRWSMITFRMALAVYTRSPSAYKALQDFRLLQLPCVRNLKDYIRSNREEAGSIQARLKACREDYDKMVMTQKQLESKTVACGEGVLIFDEVKVGINVQWNSRNEEFIGHAMTQEDMLTLHDVYDTVEESKTSKTSYVLQTLWRDLTSDYDIVGPYYTSEGGLKSKFLLACLFDAMRQFHQFNFNVSAVVCDGASANLTSLKTLCHKQGAFGSDPSNPDDPHKVPASFRNPYSGDEVFLLVCPSHQLKNMIAALHSSRPGSTKKFEIDGRNFGWKALEDLFSREVERARTNQLRRVKDLKESHIYRDCWTRLNVKPAKIMQQEHVISELKEYLNSVPTPSDAANVDLTIKYLEACNQLLERGILAHVRIWNGDSQILANMEKGYKFFCSWLDSLLAKGYNPVNTKGKKFLAWQTWDLLRIMWFGFKGFCTSYTARHPGYYVSPLRLNGSAVETLFSQLKFISDGDLSATRYPQALASLITRGSIHSKPVAGSDSYRDVTLFIREHELKK